MKRLISVLLIIFGIGVFTYPYINAKIEKLETNKNINEWNKEKTKFKTNINGNSSDMKNNTSNSLTINDKSIVGKIIVLKTKEQIPIIKGATKENLRNGATLYDNGIYPGDNGTAIILGHRETSFEFLENVKIDDEIEIETLTDKYKFKLEKTYIVKPDDPLILEQEDHPSVTLDTCYPFQHFGGTPNRFIAKYKLI
ncbi:class D sortase [Clostridium perfringens]|uniref:class D sortase n=1 Tax=Clostridium perfringens TaxID=1502 RepID=UPI0039ECB8F9